MSSDNINPTEFPNVEAKLQKPTKVSAFSAQRAKDEAKRRREAKETAAVYEDFVKSFDRDDDRDTRSSAGRGGGGGSQRHRDAPFDRRSLGFGAVPPAHGGGGGVGSSRRHFGGAPAAPSTMLPKSGPGSLGFVPTSFVKKRTFDTYERDQKDGRRAEGRLGFDDHYNEHNAHGEQAAVSRSVARAFDHSDDEEKVAPTTRDERVATAKPTLKLTQLPPGSSPATIKSLIPGNLVVDAVNILPSSSGAAGAGTGASAGAGAKIERRCVVAIVTLSQDTPANDIDAAVSALQNRYLGFGYYLSLHRHLSSAVATPAAMPSLGGTSTGAQPFGAKRVPTVAPPSYRHSSSGGGGGGGGGYKRRYAQSSSYNSHPGYGSTQRGGLLHVPVRPPSCIKTVRAINRVIEQLLAHGPEFEALLMSRPEVQREEKWAWIWDARSEGGVWYRWKLWHVVTGGTGAAGGKYVPLFEGGHAWRKPYKELTFEFTTGVDEFVSDPEYDSDDSDFDGEGNGNGNGNSYGHGNRDNQGAADETSFLNPLDKAKLAHLLARLPTTISRIRKGDVGRVAAFAATHADRGADEVVDMVLNNVETPFALALGTGPGSKFDPTGFGDRNAAPAPGDAMSVDPSAARLVGLYVASDILSSSSTSGIRGAWRFRPLFETALREKKTFESLGMMAERLGWGRMRAEKWKRSVGLVLSLWEGWCVFPAEAHKAFVDAFENPPVVRRAERKEEGGAVGGGDGNVGDGNYDVDDDDDGSGGKKGRGWKVVEAGAETADQQGWQAAGGTGKLEMDAEGMSMSMDDNDEDVEGLPMDEDDEDVEGLPMDDDGDVEGEAMEDSDEREGERTQDVGGISTLTPRANEKGRRQRDDDQDGQTERLRFGAQPGGQPRNKRMRATDMFGSDEKE